MNATTALLEKTVKPSMFKKASDNVKAFFQGKLPDSVYNELDATMTAYFLAITVPLIRYTQDPEQIRDRMLIRDLPGNIASLFIYRGIYGPMGNQFQKNGLKKTHALFSAAVIGKLVRVVFHSTASLKLSAYVDEKFIQPRLAKKAAAQEKAELADVSKATAIASPEAPKTAAPQKLASPSMRKPSPGLNIVSPAAPLSAPPRAQQPAMAYQAPNTFYNPPPSVYYMPYPGMAPLNRGLMH